MPLTATEDEPFCSDVWRSVAFTIDGATTSDVIVGDGIIAVVEG